MINQTMNMMQMNIQVRLKYIRVLKNIVIIYYQDKNRNQPYSIFCFGQEHNFIIYLMIYYSFLSLQIQS